MSIRLSREALATINSDVRQKLTVKPTKTNKHHAQATEYRGRTYDSKAEARYAMDLDLAVQAGIVRWWIPQPIVQLDALTYKPDFLVMPRNVPAYFVDVKGFETQRWKDIKKLWRAHGPDELRVIRRGKLIEVIDGRAR